MSEVKANTGGKVIVNGSDVGQMKNELDRVTAERDAGLAREAALAQNLKYAEEGYLSIAESADASAQTLHEVITRLKAERDALQALLTAADERADVLTKALNEAEHVLGCYAPPTHKVLGMISAALKPAEPAKDEHVCTGCGSRGWTASCPECVPY